MRDKVITAPFQATAATDACAIAAQAAAAWRGIDAALSPVVGRRGVAALYKRSLHVAAAAHPWLAPACRGAGEPGDFSALRQALEQQTLDHATAAHDTVLKIFLETLTSLIGESLAQRLLQPVCVHLANGDDALDKS